jgi:ComF family protein
VARFAQPIARCRTCALPLPAASVTDSAAQCGACLRHAPPLDACVAAVDYAYPWSDAITRFKFEGDTGWARPLADLLRHTPWAEPALDAADLVLPMPLADARLRERGFNQALLLARHLAPGKTHGGLLLRLRATPPQARLTRAERLRSVQGKFMADPLHAALLQGKGVLLVDDVMTSGASLFAAAQALRTAGARSVAALVVARTPEPG